MITETALNVRFHSEIEKTFVEKLVIALNNSQTKATRLYVTRKPKGWNSTGTYRRRVSIHNKTKTLSIEVNLAKNNIRGPDPAFPGLVDKRISGYADFQLSLENYQQIIDEIVQYATSEHVNTWFSNMQNRFAGNS